MNGSRLGHRTAPLIILVAVSAVAPVWAQTSASYKLTESSINSSGNPKNGVILVSPHFQIRLDSVGEPLVGTGPASASFHVDGGYVGSYAPPTEVTDLRLNAPTSLEWGPGASAMTYQVYRGALASLPGTFGTCFVGNLAAPTTTDASTPAPGQAYFYLVTGRNRLSEEGPKGYRSSGVLEPNPLPCP